MYTYPHLDAGMPTLFRVAESVLDFSDDNRKNVKDSGGDANLNPQPYTNRKPSTLKNPQPSTVHEP